MTPLTLSPLAVAPVGKRLAQGFVSRRDGKGGWATWEEPVYPPSPRGRALLDTRARGLVTLREAADGCGIPVVALSALEHGRMTLSDEDWTALEARVLELTRKVSK